MKTLNDYARECHEANIKWWLDLNRPCPNIVGTPHNPGCVTCGGHGYLMQENRDLDELIALCVSELSEALEGFRKNLMDDKLPHRKMAEVELADALIRMFDLAGGKKWELEVWLGREELPKLNLENREHLFSNFSQGLNAITRHLVKIINSRYPGSELSNAIAYVIYLGAQYSFDLEGAYNEKMAYNRHRADHKIENRLAEGGKKF